MHIASAFSRVFLSFLSDGEDSLDRAKCQIEYTSVSTSDCCFYTETKYSLTNTCEIEANYNSMYLRVECPLLWIFRSLEIHNLEEKRRGVGSGLASILPNSRTFLFVFTFDPISRMLPLLHSLLPLHSIFSWIAVIHLHL